MKQVVIFTPDNLEDMRSSVNDALWRLRNKKPLCDDDCCVIECQLENLQKILYRDDDQNEE